MTPEKDPLNYSMFTYGWIILLSIFGATAHFLDVNRHSLSYEKLKDLAIDVTIAPFTGIVTFYICEAFGLQMVMTAGIIGLVSHMGSRALCIIRRAALQRILNSQLNENNHD